MAAAAAGSPRGHRGHQSLLQVVLRQTPLSFLAYLQLPLCLSPVFNMGQFR